VTSLVQAAGSGSEAEESARNSERRLPHTNGSSVLASADIPLGRVGWGYLLLTATVVVRFVRPRMKSVVMMPSGCAYLELCEGHRAE
jgi:hypothetical protein